MFRIAVLQRFRCQTRCSGVLVHLVDDIAAYAEVDAEIQEYVFVGE